MRVSMRSCTVSQSPDPDWNFNAPSRRVQSSGGGGFLWVTLTAPPLQLTDSKHYTMTAAESDSVHITL